jgi:hypothetical protein
MTEQIGFASDRRNIVAGYYIKSKAVMDVES